MNLGLNTKHSFLKTVIFSLNIYALFHIIDHFKLIRIYCTPHDLQRCICICI